MKPGWNSSPSYPYVLAEVGKADFWLPAIESFRRLMPTAGAMTEAEADAWADRPPQASESGLFFGASNYYGTSCVKPGRLGGPLSRAP